MRLQKCVCGRVFLPPRWGANSAPQTPPNSLDGFERPLQGGGKRGKKRRKGGERKGKKGKERDGRKHSENKFLVIELWPLRCALSHSASSIRTNHPIHQHSSSSSSSAADARQSRSLSAGVQPRGRQTTEMR